MNFKRSVSFFHSNLTLEVQTHSSIFSENITKLNKNNFFFFFIYKKKEQKERERENNAKNAKNAV
jgi:hypothetical protein